MARVSGPHIRFHVSPGHAAWDHRYVAFQGPRVARWSAAGLWPPKVRAVSLNSVVYAARFDDLLSLTKRPDAWARARAVNLLEAFLLEIGDEASRPPTFRKEIPVASEPWLASLLARLDEPESDFNGDYRAFARQWGIGLSTLRRRFRAATGVALHEWVIQNRVARARALLGDTDLPIKVIAEQLGYRDIYFFTRQFRQTVGVPPATYRRSRQES